VKEQTSKQQVILNSNFVCVFLTKSVKDKFRSYTEKWNGGTSHRKASQSCYSAHLSEYFKNIFISSSVSRSAK